MTAVVATDSPSQFEGPSVRPTKGQRALWLLVLWAACAYPFSVNVVDPDLWGHVQYANDWLAEGTLSRVSSHNFTAVGYPWINHENLSELALAIGFRILGNVGMLLLKFGLGVGMLAIAWRESQRQKVPAASFLVVGILASYALHPFWLFRPQLATWLGLAAMVWILNRAFVDWHRNRVVRWAVLPLLAPLFILWTNAHGGFLAGLCLLAAYLSGRSVEAFVGKVPHAGSWTLRFAVTGLMTGAVTLLNPYGVQLHAWLIQSLAEPRPEILEWHRPSILAPVFAPFFVLLLLSLLGWAASERRRDWTQGLVLMLTVVQALMHIRHIGLFAVLALFWLPTHVSSLLQICFGQRLSSLSSLLSKRIVRMTCGAAIVVLVSSSVWRLSALPVMSERYPVQALQFMQENDLHGRLVVSFNWAQYAIAALQPKSRVGFDGRFRTCYPQHIIDKHFDLLVGDSPGLRNRGTTNPVDPTAVLREGDPELVLLDRQFPHSLEVLNKQRAEFTLLYEDKVAQLWGKRQRFGNSSTVRGKDQVPDPNWPGLPQTTRR